MNCLRALDCLGLDRHVWAGVRIVEQVQDQCDPRQGAVELAAKTAEAGAEIAEFGELQGVGLHLADDLAAGFIRIIFAACRLAELVDALVELGLTGDWSAAASLGCATGAVWDEALQQPVVFEILEPRQPRRLG
jgi:hypothetical protein